MCLCLVWANKLRSNSIKSVNYVFGISRHNPGGIIFGAHAENKSLSTDQKLHNTYIESSVQSLVQLYILIPKMFAVLSFEGASKNIHPKIECVSCMASTLTLGEKRVGNPSRST